MTDEERTALAELFELAEEGISYTSPYFREKWDMDARLAKCRLDLFDAVHSLRPDAVTVIRDPFTAKREERQP